ncbi:MAG: hypothetical protein AAB339_00800, partial [Elusimicrobiota bacterium]
MKWPEIDTQLRDSGFKVFTDQEFRSLTKTTPASAKFLLIRYAKRGLLRRLRRGLYAAGGRMPSTLALANQ